MAKNSVLENLKGIIYDMVDSNGNIRVLPTGPTGKLNLSNNRIKLLADMIKMLRDTQLLTEATKLYIFNRYMKIRDVNDSIHSDKSREEIDKQFNNTLSKIQYDKKKLESMFGDKVFVNILSNSDDISNYEKKLAEIYVKYSGESPLRKNLMLNIPKDCIASEISDSEFEDFIRTIAPYTKSQMNYIENNLGDKVCGYFNYILSLPSLGDVDQERLDMLKTLLDTDDTDKK